MPKSRSHLLAGKSRPVPTALLIIDVINNFDTVDDAAAVLPRALNIISPLLRLKERARQNKAPVIYVNDNFGRWRSDFAQIIANCRKRGQLIEALIDQLAPEKQDYVVLKPRHSGFFATPLQYLLDSLGVHQLVLTGLWTSHCVLFTAQDAYMRNFQLHIPRDCVEAYSAQDQAHALTQMRMILKAKTGSARTVDFFGDRAQRRAPSR